MPIDWNAMLIPKMNLIEIVIRGTIIYWFILLLLRVSRREAGSLGIGDLLVIVLIADAAQNGIGNYGSVTEGIVLVLTLVFWNHVVDWLGYRFKVMDHLLRPSPLLLIKDGKLLKYNMRRELISVDELMGQLRLQGLENAETVKRCYLEDDGHISVIKHDTSASEINKPPQHWAIDYCHAYGSNTTKPSFTLPCAYFSHTPKLPFYRIGIAPDRDVVFMGLFSSRAVWVDCAVRTVCFAFAKGAGCDHTEASPRPRWCIVDWPAGQRGRFALLTKPRGMAWLSCRPLALHSNHPSDPPSSSVVFQEHQSCLLFQSGLAYGRPAL